jgi:predicted permease
MFSPLRSLWRNLFSRADVERDLDAELRSYIDELTAEKMKAGMNGADARHAALIEAGGVEQIKEEVRDARKGALVETTVRDLKYGARLLRRAPGFAFLTVLTIALGIGANSAIFSVINAVVLKPLAYPNSGGLMFITSQFPTLGFEKFWVSPPEYFEYREQTREFADIAAYNMGAVNFSEGDQPERVNTAFVTWNMFRVLGVNPSVGRWFTAEEDRPNAPPVAVLSHELWTRKLGADRSVVGRQVEINGRKVTVVGIAPPGFDLHDARAQVWMPLNLDPAQRVNNRGSHFLYLVGRLKPGVTEARAEAELNTLLKGRWRELVPQGHLPNDSTHKMQMAPLQEDVVGNVRTALWVLQGAVILVLLIACANVANLLLARAEARHKEFATRTALGAGRGRILRQFMAEGILLSVLGAVLGLALARWGLKALLAANPQSIPRAAEIGLDPLVLVFTVGIALVTGLIFGLAPLLHVSEQAVAAAIKEGGARSTTTAGRNRVRRGLVVVEIALAVMLVIGAGLLMRSFRNLTSVDAGFDPSNLITFGLVLPSATYPPSGERRVQTMTNLMRRLDEIPGVDEVAAAQGLPPFRQVNANDTQFEGIPQEPGRPPQNVDYYQTVTADYFKTMRIRVKQGRGFNRSDAGGPPVVVVNEALAKRFYPNQDPVGRRLTPSFGPNPVWFTIVGVAANVKQGGLDAEPGTELYFNYEQGAGRQVPGQMNVMIRTSRSVDELAPQIRRAVSATDPALPIVQLRTMEAVFGDSVSRQRFLSLLLGIFAVVALTLAAIGTYGILSYMVTERQREIGIRMALGAGNGQVVRLVLGQGLGIALIGIVLGILGAFALSRLVASLLFGVSPADPATFGAVAAVIAGVAAVACVVPTRRATRVDPLAAIRME